MRTLFLSYRALFFWLALLVSANAATGDCYLLAAAGVGTYDHDTAKLESKILATKREGQIRSYDYRIQVDGDYKIDQSSRPIQHGVGCEVNRYWAVELDQRKGFKMAIKSRYQLAGELNGESFATNFVPFRQMVKMGGIGLSAVGSYPIGWDLSVTGRLGILHGEAEHWVFFPSKGVSILVQKEQGNLPILGLGLMYRPSRSWSIAFEAQKYNGESEVLSVLGRWHLNFL